jgi:hypothetical protein
VQVGLGDCPFERQVEVRLDLGEPSRGQEFPVGVDNKPVGGLLVDDPAPRSVFVLVMHDDGRQQGERRLGSTATPSLPGFIVGGG